LPSETGLAKTKSLSPENCACCFQPCSAFTRTEFSGSFLLDASSSRHPVCPHARVPNGEGLPGLIAQKSADLPAAEQIAYRGSLDLGNPARQKLASMEKTVPHVEVGGSGSKPG
jgi:hypothetical protein